MQSKPQVRTDWKLFVALGFLLSMILWFVLLSVQHHQTQKRISETKAAGLASVSVGWDPVSLWNQRSLFDFSTPQYRNAAYLPEIESAEDNRKIVRRAELAVIVSDVPNFQRAGSTVAESLGGYLVRSTQVEAKGGDSLLQIRVPAEQFQAALSDLQRIALRVERVHIEAADVTKEYVDNEVNLRNLRAEEAQYLSILKQTRNVPDTVLVTEKLLDVRGRIEKAQGEFDYLRSTIAFSSIAVEIRSDEVVRAFGVEWRPGVTVRKSFHGMLQGLANFADAMVFLLFRLPVLLLWVAVIGGAILGSSSLLRRFKLAWSQRFGAVLDR